MSDTQTKKSKLSIFLDYIGRNIIAEVEDDGEFIKAKNPVILHCPPAPDNSGRMAVQLLPIFFREFLADKTEDVVYSYVKKNIVQSSIDALDFRLQAQYFQLFNKNNEFVPEQPQQQPQQPSPMNADVIKLFDE
jgi:hypothetical protein